MLDFLLFLTSLFTISSQCNGQADLQEESSESYDIQVFLTKEQALNQTFPDCDTIVYDEIILTDEEKMQLQKSLKRKIFEERFIVYFGIKSG